MDRIVLLVDHQRTRSILTRHLEPRYQLLVPDALPPEGEPFDLCIVDLTASERVRDWIRTRKEAEQPVFLPVLLVVARRHAAMAGRQLRDGVDESIAAPVDGAELEVRLEGLLHRRRLSAQLKLSRDAQLQASHALRASGERYRLLFNAGSDVIIVHRTVSDPERPGAILEVNEVACTMSGRTREELLGLTIADLVAPECRDTVAAIRDTIDAEGRILTELLHETKDGRRIAVEISANAFDLEGRPAVLSIARDVSERKRAEEALRTRNNLLEAIIQASPLAIFSIDLDDMVRTWNRSAERTFGWSAAEVIGRRLPIIPADKQEEFRELRDRVLRGDSFAAMALRRQRKDGALIDISLSTALLHGPNDEAAGIMALADDVTERRRVAEALYLTQFSVDRAADGIAWFNSEGECLYVNEATCHMLGYARSELLSMRVWDLAPAFLREERKDGTTCPVDLSWSYMEREGGGYLFCFARDITEQKQAEAELVRLITAIEQAGDIVAITDLDGRLCYVNAAFDRVTDYRREEAIGQHIRALEGHGPDEPAYEAIWAAVRNGFTWEGRLSTHRKGGTSYEEDAVISPVRDAEGKVVNYVKVARDVTRQIELEAQLRQAQKMEAVGRLAGGIAHDFNNLLTVIAGYAELVQMNLRSDDLALKQVNEISKAASRAAELTGSLLAFSRKAIIKPRVISLNAVLRDVERMLRRIVGGHIAVEMHLGEDARNVKADPGQIEQIIFNLAVNARDAMPAGGMFTVATGAAVVNERTAEEHAGVAPGRYVLLTVSDTGVGMDEATQAKMFEPFFTTKGDQGTGLGLATVYGIIQQHRGHIICRSAPGKGTAFRIYLAEAESALETAPPRDGDGGPSKSEGVILVVDGNTEILELASLVLHRRGYTVFEARTGAQAFRIARGRATRIDLLLADVVLPDMSACDLAEGLTRQWPEMRVLFTSSCGSGGIDGASMAQKGYAFVCKPYRMVDMLREVPPAPRGAASTRASGGGAADIVKRPPSRLSAIALVIASARSAPAARPRRSPSSGRGAGRRGSARGSRSSRESSLRRADRRATPR